MACIMSWVNERARIESRRRPGNVAGFVPGSAVDHLVSTPIQATAGVRESESLLHQRVLHQRRRWVMRRPSTRTLSVFLSLAFVTGAVGLMPVSSEAGAPQADDLLGAWKLKYTSPDGKARQCVVALSREGAVLRADYSDAKATRPARNVAFERGELSFWVDGKYAGQVYTLTYRGRPRGNTLRGAVHWKYGWASGSLDFVGERITRSVAAIR
jgi:hypothetical protein